MKEDEFKKGTSEEERVDSIDDSLFPEFLWLPLFNEFDDSEALYQVTETDYHDMPAVMRLKRKYRDYYKWSDGMEVYMDYMRYLEDKYGSISIIKNSIEEGYPIDDYVPPKPKLKRTLENKTIMKTGIVPLRRTIKQLAIDDIKYIADANYGTPEITLDEMKLIDSTDKKAIKSFNKAIDQDAARRRVERAKTRRSYDSPGTDIVAQFYDAVRNNRYNDYGKRYVGSDKEESLTEIRARIEEEREADPDIRAYEESMLTEPFTYVNGLGVKRSKQIQMEIIKQMMSEGYSLTNFVGSSSMDKSSVKMLRAQLGVNSSVSTEDMQGLSKKKRKKMLKKLKKQKKRSKETDRRIEDILYANKISHGSNGFDFRMHNADLED